MPLRPAQPISLKDRQDRDFGRVVIERVEHDLVFGRFTPGPAYPQVERLFAEYVAAANDQLLSTVAELDERIGALGLRLQSADGAAAPAIYDVQIGDGVITFRTRPAADQPPRPLKEVMDDIGRHAEASGLTPEILESHLHEE